MWLMDYVETENKHTRVFLDDNFYSDVSNDKQSRLFKQFEAEKGEECEVSVMINLFGS